MYMDTSTHTKNDFGERNHLFDQGEPSEAEDCLRYGNKDTVAKLR